MGYFTWTDARFEHPSKNKYGYFKKSDIIPYDGYGKIVCPDDTEIIETCYDGYGMFNNQDVYELVVDWNKEYLTDIFSRLKRNDPKFWGYNLKNLAIAYQNDDTKTMESEINVLAVKMPFLKKDWKRNIGITIACENNHLLPFPIKITKSKKHIAYQDLYPSMSTQ